MLPCHQLMMLDEALAFEKLVMPNKKGEAITNTLTWKDPKKLEEFIEKLRSAAERLTTHNRFKQFISLQIGISLFFFCKTQH